jgi:uncharacterized protein with PIN domain
MAELMPCLRQSLGPEYFHGAGSVYKDLGVAEQHRGILLSKQDELVKRFSYLRAPAVILRCAASLSLMAWHLTQPFMLLLDRKKCRCDPEISEAAVRCLRSAR